MTIQARLGAVATIVVNVNTPQPVPVWDKSWNRIVYNPYGFGSITVNKVNPITTSTGNLPKPAELSVSSPGGSWYSFCQQFDK